MKFWQNIAVWLFAFSSTSCSTIFNNDGVSLSINSTPDEAKVFINGEEMDCVTPCSLEVKRQGDFAKIRVTKKGYDPARAHVFYHTHWTFYLNLALYPYGLLGMAYDYYASNHESLYTDTVEFELALLEEDEEGDEDEDEESTEKDEPMVSEWTSDDSQYSSLPQNNRMRRIEELFPRDEIVHQLILYHGKMIEGKEDSTCVRIYQILYETNEDLNSLDLDLAISRDFRQNFHLIHEKE